MQGLRLYGEEVIPLSKLVKEFCLKQGNMKETAVFQQLVYAREIWKELFRRNLWSIKNVVLDVDCKDHTIRLPEDCERLMNISIINENHKIQPLTCDPGLNTVEINCINPKCSCSVCKGEGTLCGSIDSITYTTQTVMIQGSPYTLQTWIRYDNGAVQQQQTIPSYNTSTGQVIYTTEITTLCNVEVNNKGCILPTPQNMELLNTYCGCNTFPEEQCGIRYGWNRSKNLIPQPYNYWGYWNVNAADRNIVHIFRFDTGRNFPNNGPYRNEIYQVIVSYQTNGEIPGEEILVPQFAQRAMDFGIMWLQKEYNGRESIANKARAREQYNAQVVLVNKHLNPIRMEDMAKMQTALRRW